MTAYRLDGHPLSGEEDRLHAGFLRSGKRLRPAEAPPVPDTFDRLAYDAYEYADAMLRERRRRTREARTSEAAR